MAKLNRMQSKELHGFVVSHLEPHGEPISTGEQSSDLFGTAWFEHIDVLVIPAARFDAAFWFLPDDEALDGKLAALAGRP